MAKPVPPQPTSSVADVLGGAPAKARRMLLSLRRLIYETAAELEGVGELTETLKWGEPAYLTEQSGSGSTIRLGWRASSPDECALYFICRTNLVSEFRVMFDDVLRFEGNRAILLPLGEALPKSPLKVCIGTALTYHLAKPSTLANSRLL